MSELEKKYDDLCKVAELMAKKLKFYTNQENWKAGKIYTDQNQDDCSGMHQHYGVKAQDGLTAYSAWQNRWGSVCFDPEKKAIVFSNMKTEFSVFEIYSEWKRWACKGDNLKWAEAMRLVGGDSLADGIQTRATLILLDGWKIHIPYDNSNIYIQGNIATEDGESPFLEEQKLVVMT